MLAMADFEIRKETDVKNKWKILRDVFMKEAKKVRRSRSGDPGSPNNDDIYLSKWSYFKEMSFLKDIVKPNATQGNCEESITRSDDNETQDLDFENSQAIEKSQMAEIEEAVKYLKNSEPNKSDSINERSVEVEASCNLISLKRASGLDVDASDSSSRASELNTAIKRKPKKQQVLTDFQQKMLVIEKQKIQAFNEKNDNRDDEDMLFIKSLAPYFKYVSPVQKLRLKSKIQNLIADEISMATASTSSTPRSASILPSPVNASYTNNLTSSVRNYYENDPLCLHEYETSTNDCTY